MYTNYGGVMHQRPKLGINFVTLQYVRFKKQNEPQISHQGRL